MALIEDSANRQIARSAGKVMVALLLSNVTNLVSLVLVVLILAAILAAIFAQPLVHYVLAPGFDNDPGQEAMTVNLLRIMLPSPGTFGLSGLVMGILNSHQVFFIPALTPAMYRLGMIFGVLGLSLGL